jgi:uncharacterized protein YjbI with pentapeptide repeats
MVDIRNKLGQVIFTYAGQETLWFDSADLKGVHLKDAELEGANFSSADLSEACLEGSDLYWAIFFEARLQHTNLAFAPLKGCDFKKADLRYANLRGADLGLDNLGGATQLQGANMLGCEIIEARFTGANYDKTTILPEGLNPREHGMVLVS